jgi:hypothetical protein
MLETWSRRGAPDPSRTMRVTSRIRSLAWSYDPSFGVERAQWDLENNGPRVDVPAPWRFGVLAAKKGTVTRRDRVEQGDRCRFAIDATRGQTGRAPSGRAPSGRAPSTTCRSRTHEILARVRLRALLPSWRFFDRAVAAPELLIRIADEPWQPLPVPRRRFWNWAFAPAANLALAYQSTVEQLVAQIDELDDSTDHDDPKITGLVGWALVNGIAHEVGASRWKIMRDGEDYLLGPS